MTRILLILNAVLTFPFGVALLGVPRQVFAGYGVFLDRGGALVARGYGAALVGYGVALFLMRNVKDPVVVRALMCSLIAFNTAEAILQGVAGAQGVALPAIFGTAFVHAVIAVACLMAGFRRGNPA